MSRTEKKVDTPSTVEAIRMASASVLGTTTNLGYPLGSAVGSGSMMEENSDVVAMNIAPLVFTIRDALLDAEGLELLSLEWDLERKPGPGVLPEQLVVAGGTSEGIGSHVVILSWEKGAVDPFKIDEHMQTLSKKMSDIESAIISNGMSYETHGLPVLRRFNDRLNRVIFVEMLDRRFQASWDSLQLKSEHVDKEIEVTMNFREDFTLLPPGVKVMDRTLLEFFLPRESEDKVLRHFKHRILTPRGLDAIAVKVPEAGRAILSELNMYAYSIEEVDIANAITGKFTEFLGKSEVALRDLHSFKRELDEFVSLVADSVESFEKITEQHVTSGKTLSLSDHKTEILNQIDMNADLFVGFRKIIAEALTEELVKSAQRGFYDIPEVRAWRLGSTVSYFNLYAKRTTRYFSDAMNQFLVVTAARQAFMTALNRFQDEMKRFTDEAIDKMLFDKFYVELHSQMNAIFDRVSYEGSVYRNLDEILAIINKDMLEAFERFEIWDLVGFSDVAEITKSEITSKYASESESQEVSQDGQAILAILGTFEDLVLNIIPSVADTLLSKTLIRKVIDKVLGEGADLTKEIGEFIENMTQKPDEWRGEARLWVRGYLETVEPQMKTPEKFLALLRYVHNKVGLGSTAQAIVDKVTFEANQQERAYQLIVEDWEQTCERIESENQPIRENNRKRAEAIALAESQYNEEKAQYAIDMEKYRRALEAAKALAEEVPPPALSETSPAVIEPPPLPTEPTRPQSLDVRIVEVNNQFPEMEEIPVPEKPIPPPEMHHYIGLRDLLTKQLDSMDAAQDKMKQVFAESLKQMLSEASAVSSELTIEIGEDFLEYLRNTEIRSLGKLLPRATRAYLRDPKNPEIIYLVTYEQTGNELTVAVGDTHLRNIGGV
ncbi:MAG: hypothetical protein ACFFAX_07415 [Promethearchaeota archaeon]